MKLLIGFCEKLPQLAESIEWFDYVHKSATVLIALCSLYTTYYIFSFNKNSQSADKQKDRNIQSFKVLVLDHNLKFLYSCFENLTIILNEFKAPDLTDSQKEVFNEKVNDEFRSLRIKFVDILLAIDDKLYNSIMEKLDSFQTNITESVFDNGINLSHLPKFEEIISSRQSVLKTDIIKTLHNYKG